MRLLRVIRTTFSQFQSAGARILVIFLVMSIAAGSVNCAIFAVLGEKEATKRITGAYMGGEFGLHIQCAVGRETRPMGFAELASLKKALRGVGIIQAEWMQRVTLHWHGRTFWAAGVAEEPVLENVRDTLGWVFIRGQALTEQDILERRRVGVVNLALLRKMGVPLEMALGKVILVDTTPITIIGIVRAREGLGNFVIPVIMLPLDVLQKDLRKEPNFTFRVACQNRSAEVRAKSLAERALAVLYPGHEDRGWPILTSSKLRQGVEEATESLRVSSLLLATLCAVMSLAVAWYMLRLWAQQARKEYFVRRSLGASRMTLQRQVLVSAALLGVGAALLGAATSWVAAHIMHHYFSAHSTNYAIDYRQFIVFRVEAIIWSFLFWPPILMLLAHFAHGAVLHKEPASLLA